MLLSSVKKSITKNMEQSFKMPTDDILGEKVYEALLYVATQCEPQVLLKKKNVDDEDEFRPLHSGFYVAMPEFPDFSTDRHLMIDEALSYAVVNFTCFLLGGNALFDTMTTRWIDTFRKNDLNAYAGEEINED